MRGPRFLVALAIVCVLGWAAPVHAAPPSIVETATEVTVTAGTSGNTTLTVAAGNMLVALIAQGTGTLRTFTVTDNSGSNTWANAVTISSSFVAQISYAKNTAAASTTVTVTASGSATYSFHILEISGAHLTAPLDQTSSLAEAGATNNHVSAATADVIDTAANVLVFCVGVSSTSGVSGNAPGSGYTEINSTAQPNGYMFQHQASAGALTNEQGAWSHTGTARLGNSVIASFVAAASETPKPHLLLLGVGGAE
jgi:hypothetical protein